MSGKITSTSAITPQPTSTIVGPSGFHVIGLFWTNPDGSRNSSINVIGTGNEVCSTVATNRDKYVAFVLSTEEPQGTVTRFINDPYWINTALSDFDLIPWLTSKGAYGPPLCGVVDANVTQWDYFLLFTT
jgi:hypothetical protein